MPRKPRSPGTRTPSTSDLTAKERALVDLVIEAAAEGKRFPTRQELGTRVGYGVGETARVQASRALRRPHVRDAIRAGLHENAGVDAAAAYLTLRNAAAKAPSARDRITAASKIMDMAGISSGPPMGQGPVIQFVFRHRELAAPLMRRPWDPEGTSAEAGIAFVFKDEAVEPAPATIDHQPEEASP